MGDQSAIKAGGKLPPLIATRLPEELEHEMEAETRSHYRENKSKYAQFGEPRRSRPVQFSDEKLQSRRQTIARPPMLIALPALRARQL
jgi:hypothetical protein